MNFILGIDLGGTNIKGVIIRQEDGEIVLSHQIPTNDAEDGSWRINVKQMADYLKNEVQELRGSIVGAGLSAPGLPNGDNSAIAFLPNRLHGLENFNWTEYLGLKTMVINDAHAALMAEARFGVARDKNNVILLTLGTGVGGGILLGGQLYQGLGQMAGHLGHLSIDCESHDLSIVGSPGTLEFAVGNYSVGTRTHGHFHSTYELVEAYRRGEHFATWAWLTSVRKLATAIVSLSNALSPEAIILSGGITLAGDALYGPLNAFLDVYEWRPGGKRTELLQAQFSDLAGAVGAASFVLSKIPSVH
jgi:glucokinase